MTQAWNRIVALTDNGRGFIKTSQIEALGISRPMIKKYVDRGQLEQVRKGIYVLAGDMPDEYALLQERCKDAVFSHGTALFLLGLSDRVPHVYDFTVPRGANISLLKRDNPNVRCHYIKPELYDVGIAEIKSPQGAMVKVYDKERCICDLIRDKKEIDPQVFSQAIKDFFKDKPNYRKLLKYGKLFEVEDVIRTYMEVL